MLALVKCLFWIIWRCLADSTGFGSSVFFTLSLLGPSPLQQSLFTGSETRSLCETDYCKGFPSVTKRCYVTARGSPRPHSRVIIGRRTLSFLFHFPRPAIRPTVLSFCLLRSSTNPCCVLHFALEELLLLSTRTRQTSFLSSNNITFRK